MTILLTEQEVLNFLAIEHLDMIQPNPDRVHDIALKMDMKYMELMDMYWDVEELLKARWKSKIFQFGMKIKKSYL